MFCVKCGTQVNDGRTFCPNCGSPLPGAQQQEYAQQAQYAQQQQYAQQAQYAQQQQYAQQAQYAQQQYQQYQAAPQYRQPVYQQPVQGGPLDVKRLILAIILFLMAVASILTFCFNFFTAKYSGYGSGSTKLGFSGYAVMTGALSKYGILDLFDEFDETLVTIAIVVLWILFAISLAVLALTVINLLNVILRRNILKINLNVFKLTVIGVGVVAFIFLVFGAIMTISINNEINELMMFNSSIGSLFGSGFSDYFDYSSNYPKVYTSAYWPAIIQILLIAAYVIVDKTVKAQPAAARAVKSAQPGQAPAAYAATPRKRNVDVVEEIKKYKELYDMGAITWEEFEAKKKELLM